MRLIAGAMSGTSADGVDVALVEVRSRGLEMTARLVCHQHRAYHPELRKMIFSIRENGASDLRALAQCGREVTLAYAAAVRDALQGAGVTAREVAAVAAHGQTLFHEPPHTIQWFDPALLAAETDCVVVSDFRRADCAAGGQGAPLVPFADYILFRHPTINRVLLNIGGIANVTWLPAGCSLDQVRASDTGPGNCISDYLVRTGDPDGPGIDLDGQRALSGKVNGRLLEQALRTPFFSKPWPKSTDGPHMIRAWLDARARVHDPLSLDDELATACALTTVAISDSIQTLGSVGSSGRTILAGQLIVSGGGDRNRAIMRGLQHASRQIMTIDELGLPSEAKEAIAFALLGAATLDGVPSNVPSCTGARRSVVLGSITPRP